MACQLKCSERTLYRRFVRVIKEGRMKANMSIRRKQFEMAMAGNTGMQQWLGQSDKHERSGS